MCAPKVLNTKRENSQVLILKKINYTVVTNGNGNSCLKINKISITPFEGGKNSVGQQKIWQQCYRFNFTKG
jgi:hypothetical protein